MMHPADNDGLKCDSISSSLCGSSGSLGSLVSVTTVLRAAMASGLTLTDHSHLESPKDIPDSGLYAEDSGMEIGMGRNAASKASCQTKLDPPDFAWLQERCDGDTQLALKVLRCFGEQGQAHLQALQSAMKETDTNKLVFHAVKNCHFRHIHNIWMTIHLRFPQIFLAESASNIGAWALQGRCLVLYQVAQAVILPDPDGDAVLRLLVEQVPEAHTLFNLALACFF